MNAGISGQEILIADDKLERREWIRQILKNAGFQCRSTNFSGLLTELISDVHPAAICIQGQFLDESLDSCRRISKDPLLATIPLIVCGSEPMAQAFSKVIDAGGSAYFDWPVSENVFVHVLKQQVQLRMLELSQQILQNRLIRNSQVPETLALEINNQIKTFFSSSNDLIFSINQNAVLLYASENFKLRFGYHISEWEEKSLFEGFIHPDDVPLIRAAIQYSKETQLKVDNLVYRVRHKDGHWCWQSTNAAPVLNAAGEVEAYVGIARDITSQKKAEEELQHIEEGYLGLFNTVNEAIYVHDENGVFIDANRGAEIMYGYTRFEIIGKTPAYLSAPGRNNLNEVDKIVRETFRTGKSHQFEFWGKRKNGEEFPKEVVCNRGKYFGKDVLITTARDVTEKWKEQDKIRASEEKFSKIFHISPDVVLLTRVSDGVIVDINDRVFELSGFKREEVIGKTTLELEGWADDTDRGSYIALLKRDGHVSGFEKQFKIKGGIIRDASISGELVDIQGEKFILTIIRDITDWKRTKEKLEEETLKLQLLNDNLPDTVVYQLTQEPGGHIFFSYLGKGMERITGIPTEKLMENAWNLYSYTEEKQREEILRLQKESCKNLSVFEAEVSFILPNGETRWFHLLSSPRKMPDGRIIWDGVQSDITERKRVTLKVAESEEKYRLLVENALDMIYTLDADLNIKTVNNAVIKLFGYKPEEMIGKGASFIISEDQLELNQSMLQRKIDGEEQTRYEMTFTARDGHIVPMELQTRILYKDGKFDGILGIARDITNRKKAEEALQMALKELSDYKYALDMAANVSISDESGTILYVNENFCKQYGYTADEVIGQNHSILNSDYHPHSFWENFWKSIQAGKVLKAEVRNKGKDGRFYWADTTIVPFFNLDGKPYQYVAIRRDITEKRKLEQELAAQQLHNQRLITEITIQEQEKEKNNISRELHENIIQILAGAKIYLGIAQSKTEKQDQMLAESYEYLNRAMDMIRNLSHSLVTPTLSDFGLVEALIDLAVETSKTSKVRVSVDNQTREKISLENKQVLLLYRIVQEQLENITRYARAENARIRIYNENEMLQLSVEDDGVGFDPATVKLGFGLTSIRNRVEFYGGRMIILSAPGKGCKLEILLPVRQFHTTNPEADA